MMCAASAGPVVRRGLSRSLLLANRLNSIGTQVRVCDAFRTCDRFALLRPTSSLWQPPVVEERNRRSFRRRGAGWNTGAAKVIDNAIVGCCRETQLDRASQEKAVIARGKELCIYDEIVTEAKSVISPETTRGRTTYGPYG